MNSYFVDTEAAAVEQKTGCFEDTEEIAEAKAALGYFEPSTEMPAEQQLADLFGFG